jgi:hypothetical protein
VCLWYHLKIDSCHIDERAIIDLAFFDNDLQLITCTS